MKGLVKLTAAAVIVLALGYALFYMSAIFVYVLAQPWVRDETLPFGTSHGIKFEIYYNYALPDKDFLVVNGKHLIRTYVDKGWPFEEVVKDAVIAVDSSSGFLKSFLVKGEYYIYQTHEMKGFAVLGKKSSNESWINCESLLEDMGRIINGEYPIHAAQASGDSAPFPIYGIYQGFGYKIEQLTNGKETEWQAYRGRDEKIFAWRWAN